MHDLTGVHIEKRAVMEFIRYFEEQMDRVISQSARELERRNGFNGIQGLRPNQRIDQECVRDAIKAISNNNNPSLPGRAGGNTRRKPENIKHPHENTEVT